MPLTVAGVLQLDCLRGTRVLAGQEHIDNEVRWVNIMEVPEVARWLKGGELLFTSAFAIRNDEDRQRRVIRDLARVKIAALAVKPGQYVNSTPQAMIDECAAAQLPLVEIPSDRAYMDIAAQILEILVSEELAAHRVWRSTHEQLMALALDDEGFQGICRLLKKSSGHFPLIIDAHGAILASQLDPDYCFLEESDIFDTLRASLHDRDRNALPAGFTGDRRETHPSKYQRELRLRGKTLSLLAVPILHKGRVGGHIVLLRGSKPFSREDLMLGEQSSIVGAVQFSKKHAAAEAEERMHGALVEELLFGHEMNASGLVQRATHFGFDLNGPHAVLVFGISRRTDPGPSETYQGPSSRQTDDRAAVLVERALSESEHPMVLGTIAGRRVCIAQMPGERHIAALVKRLSTVIAGGRRAGAGQHPLPVTVGVSRIRQGPREVRRSYSEALRTLEIGRRAGLGPVVRYDGLGPFRLLMQIVDCTESAEFVRDALGALRKYDRDRGGELCRTLAAYFRHNCNIRASAEALHIHRNTLTYRLRTIERLSGRSLDDHNDRLELELALRTMAIAGESYPD